MKKSILTMAALFAALLFQTSANAEFYTSILKSGGFNGWTAEVSAYQRVASNEDPDDLEDVKFIIITASDHEGGVASELVWLPNGFDHEYDTVSVTFESSIIPLDEADIYFYGPNFSVVSSTLNKTIFSQAHASFLHGGGWYWWDPDDIDIDVTDVDIDM